MRLTGLKGRMLSKGPGQAQEMGRWESHQGLQGQIQNAAPWSGQSHRTDWEQPRGEKAWGYWGTGGRTWPSNRCWQLSCVLGCIQSTVGSRGGREFFPSALLWWDPPGALCPALESPAQEGHGAVGKRQVYIWACILGVAEWEICEVNRKLGRQEDEIQMPGCRNGKNPEGPEPFSAFLCESMHNVNSCYSEMSSWVSGR